MGVVNVTAWITIRLFSFSTLQGDICRCVCVCVCEPTISPASREPEHFTPVKASAPQKAESFNSVLTLEVRHSARTPPLQGNPPDTCKPAENGHFSQQVRLLSSDVHHPPMETQLCFWLLGEDEGTTKKNQTPNVLSGAQGQNKEAEEEEEEKKEAGLKDDEKRNDSSASRFRDLSDEEERGWW